MPQVGERTAADDWRSHPCWGNVAPLEMVNAEGLTFTGSWWWRPIPMTRAWAPAA